MVDNVKSAYLAIATACAFGLTADIGHAYSNDSGNKETSPHSLTSDSAHQPTTEKPLAFHEVNQQLLTNYSAAKSELRKKLGAIVICMDNSLTLIRDGKRESIPFIKPHYTGLKEVAHITLGTFVLLVNHTDEELSESSIAKLKEYRTAIEKASDAVATDEAIEPQEQERQRALIKQTVSFLTRAIESKRVSADELKKYARSTSEPDLKNAYTAVASQMVSMDKTMAKWRKEMTPQEWNNMYVFIATLHMPRQELIAYQYFARLLNQSQEGDRVIVGESPGTMTEEQGIDLVLTHILDKQVAIQFFNDPWRMHRDLLSEAGKKWLSENKLEAEKTP
ncbi:MAG: hypothetical protein JST44_23135 [Cyanobacteria bacterium SZAS LIN-5]|nr:hypothetical protein [Cyanobacteria bacterium SZAS LIN-5]